MKLSKEDRTERITQKFLGLRMWATRAENCMMLGLGEKCEEAIKMMIKVTHEIREINDQG